MQTLQQPNNNKYHARRQHGASSAALTISCSITYEYACRDDYDGDGTIRRAFKIVEEGGGWVEVLFQAWPGFGYWIASGQKNPLDPMPEDLEGKIKVGRASEESRQPDPIPEVIMRKIAESRQGGGGETV